MGLFRGPLTLRRRISPPENPSAEEPARRKNFSAEESRLPQKPVRKITPKTRKTMRLLIQRVKQASVTIDGRLHARIGAGLLVLVGVGNDDDGEDLEYLAGKLVRLRIFDDAQGVMNLDVVQTGGEVLVVSQFTLMASTRKGNRPSYIKAAPEAISRPLYERFAARVGELTGRAVATGVFGADMQVELVNDGPVTIWIDSKNKE